MSPHRTARGTRAHAAGRAGVLYLEVRKCGRPSSGPSGWLALRPQADAQTTSRRRASRSSRRREAIRTVPTATGVARRMISTGRSGSCAICADVGWPPTRPPASWAASCGNSSLPAATTKLRRGRRYVADELDGTTRERVKHVQEATLLAARAEHEDRDDLRRQTAEAARGWPTCSALECVTSRRLTPSAPAGTCTPPRPAPRPTPATGVGRWFEGPGRGARRSPDSPWCCGCTSVFSAAWMLPDRVTSHRTASARPPASSMMRAVSRSSSTSVESPVELSAWVMGAAGP
jgi:hypothetical protein